MLPDIFYMASYHLNTPDKLFARTAEAFMRQKKNAGKKSLGRTLFFASVILTAVLLLHPAISIAACSRDGDVALCTTKGEAIAYATEYSNSCGMLCGCNFAVDEPTKHIYFGAYIYTGDLYKIDLSKCLQSTWAYTYFHVVWTNDCTNDPCCGSTELCCGSKDPCCGDPCCGGCCFGGGSGSGNNPGTAGNP